jgi:hypothetical protein
LPRHRRKQKQRVTSRRVADFDGESSGSRLAKFAETYRIGPGFKCNDWEHPTDQTKVLAEINGLRDYLRFWNSP